MDSTPTILAIKVTCGRVTCADCDWHKGDDEDGECLMFERSLVDGIVRCPECVEAQARADDMMLKTAIAKAEVKPAEAPAVSAEEHGD